MTGVDLEFHYSQKLTNDLQKQVGFMDTKTEKNWVYTSRLHFLFKTAVFTWWV